MANTITNVVPKLVGLMLPKLRAHSVMPRLVNRDFDTLGAQPGSSIDVPIPPTITTAAVSADKTPPTTSDITLSTVNVPLSSWNEAAFYMTDKDLMEVEADKLPGVVDSALASIVEKIDQDILEATMNGHGLADNQDASPLSAIAEVTAPQKLLNKNKVPRGDRFCVFNEDAEANLLALEQFTSGDYVTGFPFEAGDVGLQPKMGMSWVMSQNVRTHTTGTADANYDLNGAASIGDKTITVDTGSGTILEGDTVTIGSYNYGVASTVGGSTVTSITLNQGLLEDIADGTSIAVIDTGGNTNTGNVAFHRDSVVFVSRPFQASNAAIASQTISDPISGLSLRLEVTREYKRDRWSIDALYGTKVVRPEGVVKVIG
ncbi:MAG: hypothetical protein CMF19_07015 [Idiomarinaceae bacterium]|nr:hypothetical protein [Idiomarinaceae bacterium]